MAMGGTIVLGPVSTEESDWLASKYPDVPAEKFYTIRGFAICLALKTDHASFDCRDLQSEVDEIVEAFRLGEVRSLKPDADGWYNLGE